jgi:nucleoside-diphosphate-sugar epimerase
MKILVTGGTGFTGSHLVRRLLEEGHAVRVIDVQRGLFFEELQRMGAEIFIGSITDRELVRRAVAGCQVVHHMAAMFRKVNLPKKVYWEVNVEGTRALLDAALKFGIEKLVYCSTCGVHGNVRTKVADENSPVLPEDYYQYTKYEGERVAAEFINKGLQVTTLRPTAIYGPGDPERFLRLFRMVASGRFLMFGNGNIHYHPLYIDNLVDAFELAARADQGTCEAYLIGDEKSYTLNELVLAIGEVLGVNVAIRHYPFWPLWIAAVACEAAYKPLPMEPPLFRRRVDWFRQNRAFSIEKAKRNLGYQPKVGLKEGLAKTAEWYRINGYLPRRMPIVHHEPAVR